MALEDVRRMPLHSDAMEPPFGPLVLLHWLVMRVIVMREAIGKPHQRNAYVASSIITPWHWLLEKVHRELFRTLNKKLQDGGSAGETFRQSKLEDAQNSLLLFKVPAKCLPARLRDKSDIEDDILRVDVYELGGFLPRLRRFLQYGVFSDFCPESIPPPKKRVSLGSRWIWWLAGRPYEFAYRLRVQDQNDAPLHVLEVARAVGKAKACALLPVLFLLAVFAKEKNKTI